MRNRTSTVERLPGDFSAHRSTAGEYLRAKVDHPDTPVLDRMSDFHGLFYDEVRTSGRIARKLQVVSDRKRPPQATNGSFVDAEREGSGPVVGQLWSASMGWYGSKRLVRERLLPRIEA